MSESRLVGQPSLRVAPVPALDGEGGLVDLLDKPLGLLLGDLPPPGQHGAALQRRHRRPVVGARGGRGEVLLGLGQGAVLQQHLIVGRGLQDVARRTKLKQNISESAAIEDLQRTHSRTYLKEGFWLELLGVSGFSE